MCFAPLIPVTQDQEPRQYFQTVNYSLFTTALDFRRLWISTAT
jgi:hypothetical protein